MHMHFVCMYVSKIFLCLIYVMFVCMVNGMNIVRIRSWDSTYRFAGSLAP